MISFLFSRTGAAMIGIVAAALIATWAVNSAYQAGRTTERTAILNRSVEILSERNTTDDEIRNLDDASLCVALDGVFADGSCQ
jgi:hypothetical protein